MSGEANVDGERLPSKHLHGYLAVGGMAPRKNF